jgi:hypothetical protein
MTEGKKFETIETQNNYNLEVSGKVNQIQVFYTQSDRH